MDTAAVTVPTDLLDALRRAASGQAALWFPELGDGPVGLRVLGTDARARCYLHRVQLETPAGVRPVVVKVRHSDPALRRLDRFEDRPVLTPERTMSDRDSARREYDDLRAIAEAMRGSEPDRFGVLRPLAWLPDQAGIVMDLVSEPTLRARLLRTSRLRRRRLAPMDDAPWRNAGAWLRRFHDHGTDGELPARLTTRDEVTEQLASAAAFVTGRGARSALLRRLSDRPEATTAVLPSSLPLVPGHGDFVANNMFAGSAGRITVFDPLTRWRVPRGHDLATLTTGLHVLPLQAASQGAALPAADLERYERAVLTGYFGEDVPWGEVRVHQLLVLLDRWSALVSKSTRAGGPRSLVRAGRVGLATRHFAGEARRLVGELDRLG